MTTKKLSKRALKTQKRIQFIANNPDMMGKEIAKRFGISTQAVFSFKHVHKRAIAAARKQEDMPPLDLTGYESDGMVQTITAPTLKALTAHLSGGHGKERASEKEHAEKSQPKYLLSLAEMLEYEAKTLRTTSGEQKVVAAQLRRIADAVEHRI